MNKVLVVGDEKQIRMGIIAMLQRTNVPIEEIMESSDETDAYDIVVNQEIDVMILDIGPAKMGGIMLVKKVQNATHIPKILILGEQNDFRNVVDLFRCGVCEYLLKPIVVESLHEVILKLHNEIIEEQGQKQEFVSILYEQIRFLLKNQQTPISVRRMLQDQMQKILGKMSFVLICSNYYIAKNNLPEDSFFYFLNISEHNIYLMHPNHVERFLEECPCRCYVGMSRPFSSLVDIYAAYEEAVLVREHKFSKQKGKYNLCHRKYLINIRELECVNHLLGTARFDKADKYLLGLVERTKHGEISLQEYRESMSIIINKIESTYGKILHKQGCELEALENMFVFDTIDDYYKELKFLLDLIKQSMAVDFDAYRTKIKMEEAIRFIHDNFGKDINMAMVSNQISMNYSCFSITFKEYTGMNFVNYLRDVRLKEAKRLLDESDDTISKISSAVGYENEKHFMKQFKSTFEVTPTEYRKNKQMGNGTRFIKNLKNI